MRFLDPFLFPHNICYISSFLYLKFKIGGIELCPSFVNRTKAQSKRRPTKTFTWAIAVASIGGRTFFKVYIHSILQARLRKLIISLFLKFSCITKFQN
jgi:hypothetical protein